MILLTSSEPHVLKSTIHSRVQGITVVNPDKQSIEQHFTNSGHKSIDVEKAYQLSGGYIGLMHALLDTETSHPLAESIQVAKRWYEAGSFDRLTMIEDIVKQRDDLAQFIFACKRIRSSAFAAAAKTGDITKITQWHKQLSVVVGAENSLRYTPNAKLLLTDLCMSM